ncbi:MAG: DUF134 domain-containing protein [Actinomycetota bacterium]|nr:DUF134 domain-containing protein [Actinomycetota bacterium]
MPRPVKCRRIESKPDVELFKPRGIPAFMLEEVVLGFEELEAVRLKDLEGLDQASAAARMDISRPTFQRILRSARAKISDALVNGKAIRIEGGNYEITSDVCNCRVCGHLWRTRETGGCPECSGNDIERSVPKRRGCSVEVPECI